MTSPYESTPETASSPEQYRAVPAMAVLSVVFGALSILTVFSWHFVAIPLIGIALGWKALKQIRQTPVEWTGLGVARLGIMLSAVLWAVGYGWLMFAQTSEVPYGYQRVSYEMLQPNPEVPSEWIPQAAHDLQDKRVYVKGFMQPRRKQTGIKEFVLVPAMADCPYCNPDPKSTEMIRIELQGDLEAIYTTHQVGVGGRFQVDPSDPSGIPYLIEANYFR